jgi:crotonobetainyl-CoA hydratase
MSFEFILYEKRERIAYVTINRPDRLNAIHPPASAELYEAFCDFRDDPAVWVSILTGTGERAFSAGNDLKYTAEHGMDLGRAVDGAPFGGITSSFTCWKPIIAAVNGYALGGGLEIAMACDIIVAADHAEFGQPEPRVGLVAGTGVHRLPRHVPLKVAMGMLLTGRRIGAQEAHRVGLVNEVVPLGQLMPTAQRWANEILELAPLSTRASKQMAMTGLDSPLDVAMSRSYSEHLRALASADFVEGPRAFYEKRKPNWTGA